MPNGTNDGVLAWSIGFSDAVRAEITPSRSRSLSATMTLRSAASSDQDSLLGSSGAIVGTESLATDQTIPAEGKIRGTLILTLATTSATANLSKAGGVDMATVAFTDPFAPNWNRSVSALGMSTNQAESVSIF
jgi:hypothetical protein